LLKLNTRDIILIYLMGYEYVHELHICIYMYYEYIQLQMMLNNPTVRNEVFTSHCGTDEVMRDFCDASFVKNHPIFISHPLALQFVLFYDDIEVANALGAKAGSHKLGKIYLQCCTCAESYIILVTCSCNSCIIYIIVLFV